HKAVIAQQQLIHLPLRPVLHVGIEAVIISLLGSHIGKPHWRTPITIGVRQWVYLPKRTNFNTINHYQIKQVENDLNNRPRKTLNFKSPKELFLCETSF
ncbi:MAG TPA: hypothetical protein PKI54_12500, partial [Bacteroidia bacterium]|nr:hypothetical protein [Bacteroidia bacterium]